MIFRGGKGCKFLKKVVVPRNYGRTMGWEKINIT